MLKQLRLRGVSQIDGQGVETLELALHFGMPTQLLDWISNPLAGLWFAC